MKISQLLFIGLLFFLNACGSEDKTKPFSETATKATPPTLAYGTKIDSIKKPSAVEPAEDKQYRALKWEELSPEGGLQEKVINKYQPLIDATPEASPKEKGILKKMMAELNHIPANKKLDGQMIKLPGFMSPLEIVDGKIKEFLLVPYYGACIHVPPPPINNTLLIKTQKKYEMPIENDRMPVWVMGKMTVKTSKTDLAEAGYLIENAKVVIFKDDDTYAGDDPSNNETKDF